MKSYEEAFIQVLQNYDPRDPEACDASELLAYLSPASRHRWRAYADSYVFRVSNALTETILERAAMLYNDAFIKQLVFEYVRENPPTAALMPDCLDGFADFVRGQPAGEKHPELVDLLELSQARWKVLIGVDPQPAPEDIFADPERWAELFLQENSAFIASKFPLHSLWSAGDPDRDRSEDHFIPDASEGVLLCKSSPIVLHGVKIEPGFFPLMHALAGGQSLAAALDSLDGEEFDEAAFIDLLRRLREAAAFQTKET